jgi:uncharacterized membrane protein YeaQ/YmgE (transglycosylase-associated protein family)
MRDLWDVVQLLVIGLVAGWIAARLLGGRRYTLLGALVIGVTGALLGNALFRAANLPTSHVVFWFASALLGALLIVFLLRLVRGRGGV